MWKRHADQIKPADEKLMMEGSNEWRTHLIPRQDALKRDVAIPLLSESEAKDMRG